MGEHRDEETASADAPEVRARDAAVDGDDQQQTEAPEEGALEDRQEPGSGGRQDS